jgi:hypothetical protein
MKTIPPSAPLKRRTGIGYLAIARSKDNARPPVSIREAGE